ncbi:MAG: hypothetical protein KBD50_03005 [Candidatus Pacebacteria bacterium]|nr:hypothetical protein [Candidatus Paceibacterota bacterium]
MSALFKRKKEEGNTVLLLDVENGSVGSALVRLSPHEAPRLFGETRVQIPLLKTHAPGSITKEIEQAARHALDHVAQVAARVRVHSSESVGTVAHTAVFMSPPWATLNLGYDTVPHPITQSIYNSLVTLLGPAVSTSFHPFATATAHMVPSLFPHEERYLLCVVSGEVMEMIALERSEWDSQVLGHATIPFGRNSIMRTLKAHGGLSVGEALSALKLVRHGHMSPMHEPLTSLAVHIGAEFDEVARELATGGTLRSVFVVAEEPVGEWFARSLADHASLETLFPEGGTVRAVRGSHISPFIAIHAHKPDIALLLEALFIDARLPKAKVEAIR